MAVITGIIKQINATDRHAIKVFSPKTMNIPNVTLMLEYAIKTPRVDGSLKFQNGIFLAHKILKLENVEFYHISPRYVINGASIMPIPNPSKA